MTCHSYLASFDSPPIGLGALEDFSRVFNHKANQNSPKSTKKGGLPRPPQVRRIPVPKDDAIVVYHEELFCRDGHLMTFIPNHPSIHVRTTWA